MRAVVRRTAVMLLSLFLLVGISFSAVVFAEEDTEETGDMNLDVIFVLDSSGSMLESDPDRVAIDACSLFMDLCDSSCAGGYVVYTQDIKASADIVPFSSKPKLKKMKSSLSDVRYDPYGGTDIALGLTKAKTTFENYKTDSSRKRVIVLLSDGNTDISGGTRTVEDSKKEMDVTLNELKKMGIPVYALGLNYDGSLARDEIDKIAKTTGGKAYETKSSDELTETFSDIFSDIYKINGTDLKIKDGNVKIDIKDNSVFYVNIIINSKYTLEQLNPELTNPKGKKVPLDDSGVKATSGDRYTLIKLIYPKSGVWNMHLDNATNENCSVSQISFYSVFVRQILDEKVGLGSDLTIISTVNDSNGVISDIDLLSKITMKAYIKEKSSGKETEVALKKNPQNQYVGKYTPEAKGEYQVRTVAKSDKFEKESIVGTVKVVDPSEIPESSVVLPDENLDTANGFFWQLITIIGIGVVVVVIIIIVVMVVIGVIKAKAKQNELPPIPTSPAPKPPAPAPAPRPRPQPQKPAPRQPDAPPPEYVDIPLLEHDKLENLIKRGSDDAFSTKSADQYETDASLEALIRKGADDPFQANADNYEIDPALAALIRTGGDSLGDKIEPEPEKEDSDEDDTGA